MIRLSGILCLAAASLALAGCGADRAPPPSSAGTVATEPATSGPAQFADRTKLDEQVGLTVTLSYTAAAKLAKLAIETGVVKDKATIARIGVLGERAGDAVDGVRAAYLTGNSDNYLAALKQARGAVANLVSAVGDKP